MLYSRNTLTLSTLGQNTALVASTKIDGTRLQGVKIIDIFGAFSMDGKTTGEGPIYYGFVVNDLTVAEIAEAFAADPQSQDDDPATSRADRKLIVVGQYGEAATSSQIAAQEQKWEKQMWPKSWVIREGNGFNIFAFNVGAALTTGTVIRWDGVIKSEWRQD